MELQRIGLRIRSLLKLTPPPNEEPIAEEPVVIRRPPILLRLEDCEKDLETIPQFLGYGWAFGSEHYLTTAIHDSVHRACSHNHPFSVQTARFEIETLSEMHDSLTISVKASQIVTSDHYVFEGPLFAAMFLPSGYTIYGESMLNEWVGGPSVVYLRLIQKIAMKLCCRINTIETARDGATLIIFTPWDTSKTFFDLIDKVDDRTTHRDVDS